MSRLDITDTNLLLFYNGFTFPVETWLEDISSTPVKDEAGRAIAYIRYVITFGSQIVVHEQDDGGDPELGGGDTDRRIGFIRNVLQEPAGQLFIHGVGFDNMTINGGGPVKDVKWGPWPTVLSLKHRGQDTAWDLLWQVTVNIPECVPPEYTKKIMEYNYSVRYSIDREGLTTRVYEGYVTIPQTRKSPSARELQDQVDRVREDISVPAVPGFRRIPGEFLISKDKCRLDFTIQDIELPTKNAPPPGATDVQISRTAETQPLSFVRWMQTITGRYNISKNFSRESAWNHFCTFINRIFGEITKRGRIAPGGAGAPGAGGGAGAGGGGGVDPDKERARRGINAFTFFGNIFIPGFREAFPEIPGAPVVEGGAAGAAGGGGGGCIIPTRFVAREPEVYGIRSAEFHYSFAVNLPGGLAQNIHTALSSQALWILPPGNGWDEWRNSMDALLNWHIRGTAGLAFSKNDDVIVDLCLEGPPKKPEPRDIKGGPPGTPKPGPRLPPGGKIDRPDSPGLNPDPPGSPGGLIDPVRRVPGGGGTLQRQGGGLLLQMPRPHVTPQNSWMEYRLQFRVEEKDNNAVHVIIPGKATEAVLRTTPLSALRGYQPGDYKNAEDHISQIRAAPQVYVTVAGYAMRAGFEITPPKLKKIFGVDVIAMNDGQTFQQSLVGDTGVPIYSASWALRYMLLGTPKRPEPSPLTTTETRRRGDEA